VCPETTNCDSSSVGPARLRLATWNIKAASQQGLDAVVDELDQLDADVVLLQEVDIGVERSGNVDQPRTISTRLGYQYAFAPTLELEGGAYGIAVLSRLPFEAVDRISLTNEGAAEPRVALDVHVCLGSTSLRVTNHHADYTVAAAQKSVLEVLMALENGREERVVFAGDFNQEPEDIGPTACVEAGFTDAVVPFDASGTRGARRIDYVFVGNAIATWVVGAGVVDGDASDHRALVVDMQP
jgi:endonuclease/exonuclease/phosphatase family metal-dependent hydrolase